MNIGANQIMKQRVSTFILIGIISALGASAALAAPVRYVLDPNHTYPSFEADHMGGLSTWRGKFNSSSGIVELDREAQTGSLTAKIDIASIDFGHDKMNEHARSADIFDAKGYPTATYTGKLAEFKNGAPTKVIGVLTLKGVSKSVNLDVHEFLCKNNPMNGKEVCGADISGTINRASFGVDFGNNMGFDMTTQLKIQVEAVREQDHE
jgi:polyisoprenoid-binding protein YceI